MKCQTCSKECKGERGLKLHMLKKHGEAQNGEAKRKPVRRKKGVALCYCPSCGVNLQHLAVALETIGGLHG
jgi:hypothetical protein